MEALPQWLSAVLPPLKEPARVEFEHGKNVIYWQDGMTLEIARDELSAVSEALLQHDYILADSFTEEHSPGTMDGDVFFPVGRNLSGWLHSYSDKDRLSSLELSYESALRANIRYQSDPTDFVNAYQFVDAHPAFWTNANLEDTPWYWTTDGHCGRIYQYVGRRDEGPLIGLETGGHVKGGGTPGTSDYSSHYHDYRLDVYASTFEEAFVSLAALVDKFFYPDGTEKEDVAHEKPEWVLQLEERMAELELEGDEDEG